MKYVKTVRVLVIAAVNVKIVLTKAVCLNAHLVNFVMMENAYLIMVHAGNVIHARPLAKKYPVHLNALTVKLAADLAVNLKNIIPLVISVLMVSLNQYVEIVKIVEYMVANLENAHRVIAAKTISVNLIVIQNVNFVKTPHVYQNVIQKTA